MNDQTPPPPPPQPNLTEEVLYRLFESQRQQADLLAALSARLEALALPAPPPANELAPPQGRPPKAVLPNPPRFSGKRGEYQSWRLEVEAKIRIDGLALGNINNQFHYLFGRMEPSA